MKRLWRRIRDWRALYQLALALLPVFIAGVFFTTKDVILVKGAAAAPATCAIDQAEPATQLTAENDFRHGVWSFSSPSSFPGFTDQTVRPSDGVEWLPNCRVVAVRCVKTGGRYGFVNQIGSQEVEMSWRLWVQLKDNSWLPLASVGETTGFRQPQLQLPRCS
ncbi:MAG TPA: hypothetical protein VKR79_07600 [Gaiellaceae bacterium]|nr:hypothetical protein [Gaiellaceae bacterium]